MGCFLACFTASNRKRKYLMDASPSKHNSDGANEVMLNSVSTINQQDTEEPITESKEKKLEEQLSCNGKKKVTFNLNDRFNEGLEKEGSDNVIENNEEKVKESSNESKLVTDLISSDEASNPPNNRYQNYRKQEFEDLDLEDSGLDGSRDNVGSESKISVQAESSDSLFSISIDSRKHISRAEVGENEVSSPMPKNSSSLEELRANGSNQNAQNRIENLSQCTAVKTRSAILPLHNQDKENNNVERDFSSAATLSEEPSFKLLSSNGKVNSNGKAEISVDTSLSSWLIQSEITTPLSKNSAESSDSLFSISIDSRKQISRAEVGENEVSSPMPKNSSSLEELKANGSNQNAQNRIENLSQCTAVKTRSAILPLHNQDKENNNVERGFSSAVTLSEEPSFKLLSSNGKVNSNGKAEISVDTSLSSWLIQSEVTTPLSKNSANSIENSLPVNESSPRSHKDRNILGELSVNTLKHGSASTTSRQKRSQAPDDMPIIGTIGSYWHHTGRNVDSDSNSSRSKGMLTLEAKLGMRMR